MGLTPNSANLVKVTSRSTVEPGIARRCSQGAPLSRRAFGRILTVALFTRTGLTIAQDSTVIRRIGRLWPGAPETPEEVRQQADPLRQLGWVEGRNLTVERRYANGREELLKPLAEELVRLKVEVIVTGGTAATLAAKRATTTVPIVFEAAGDPVLVGLVASLARPGGNITGFSLASAEVNAKRLTVLKELIPGLRRIGVLEPSTNPYFRVARSQFQHTCRLLGLEPVFVQVDAASEIDGAIAQLARQGVQALVLRGDVLLYDHRLEVTGAALKHGLPTMAEQPLFPRNGGALISYTATDAEGDRRTASFVDRILRGAKPAELPVEQPTQFELVINLKTARALGLTVPQALLLRADEVIK